jgi:hypothetical protein
MNGSEHFPQTKACLVRPVVKVVVLSSATATHTAVSTTHKNVVLFVAKS